MRVALGIEYDGSCYRGWQRQQAVNSVQEALEKAISKVANEPITVHCAGRTDAGVHASGQVVHFDHTNPRDCVSWVLGVNSQLPPHIAVQWAKPVSEEFHARYTATARRYRYLVCNQATRPSHFFQGVTNIRPTLNETKMHEAAQCLLGEHDFTSFRAKDCQSNSPFRRLTDISVTRFNQFVMLDLTGNAFLHHMVRNIMGTLLIIGKEEQPVEWLADVLAARDRTKAGPTAKPYGLYLVDVTYPKELGIPTTPLGPVFVPD